MHIAYLINQHPKISHTFIRREIEALEQQGVTVSRFALRGSPDKLLTPADLAEQQRTRVILGVGAAGLGWGLLRVLLTRSRAFLRALRLALRLSRGSERGALVHVAYLAEACVLLGWLFEAGVQRVHAHFGTNAPEVALLCKTLGGPNYSFTIHGPEEFDKPESLHLREKIEGAEAVFAVSAFGRSQVLRHCDRAHWDKVHVVRCGVDQSFLDTPPVAAPNAPELVSIGRLSEQKGQLCLIDALGELHRRGREFHLTLLGDGELRAPIEGAIARHGLGAKVTLAGWASEATVRERILASRAMVLPSFAEGLPVVIMEALALGRPVLSTYIAGIPELVEPGKDGWLVPAGTVTELADALEAVLDATPAHLDALGAEGRRRVRERHDIRVIGQQLAGLFASIKQG
jgi:colanic acid/amylovoran biosynthesis glycosyltransferase